MQYLNTRKAIGLILALAFFIGGTHTALAVGTASDTTISNTATVDYDVSGDARSASGAAPDFKVDNKVDLTVTSAGNVTTTPGATGQVLTYTVTNTGNTPQGYSLTATNAAGDDFDMTGISIYIEDGTTPGFQSTEDTAYVSGSGNNAFDLAADATSVNVYVVATTPGTATDTQVAGIDLLATTLDNGTNTVTTADASPDADPLVVDTVFADGTGSIDGPRDGGFATAATYTVQSALLSATKTIANVADQFNATGGFSIPGAVVRYLITTTAGGTGTVDANSVVVSDPIPANTKLCVAVDASAPVVCTAADVPTYAVGTSGLTGSTLEYSTNNGTTWIDWATTPPTADADGADTTVTDVRYTTAGTVTNGGSFTVTIGVVIE